MMPNEKSMLVISIILGVLMIIMVAIKPSLVSLEAPMLALIAVYMAGIYTELARANKRALEEKEG